PAPDDDDVLVRAFGVHDCCPLNLPPWGLASRREVQPSGPPRPAPRYSARIRERVSSLSPPDRRPATPLRRSPPRQTGWSSPPSRPPVPVHRRPSRPRRGNESPAAPPTGRSSFPPGPLSSGPLRTSHRG